MTAEHIPALKLLWQEAFGDPAPVIDAFFATGFSPDRCNCLLQDGKPVSALHWFDCQLGSKKLAYIYAVATLKSHRGKGLGRKLLENTHHLLRTKGYTGCLLVPGSEELFGCYETFGYRTATAISEFSCRAGRHPIPAREIPAREYTRLRQTLLPAGGVIQKDSALDFLQTQGQFYTGDGWLLAGSAENSILTVQEFLGDPQIAPAILRALNCREGRFRAPGADRPFSMLLPLSADCPAPAYFGLAVD